MPINAYQEAVGDLQFNIVPSDRDWVALDIHPAAKARLAEGLSEEAAADRHAALLKILYDQNRLTFEFLRRSNFDTEIHCAFQDVFASTGALQVMENPSDPDNPLLFKCVPFGRMHPEAGPYGAIETVFRTIKEHYRNLDRIWPDATWTAETQRNILEAPDMEITLIEANIFNPDKGNWDYIILEGGNDTRESMMQIAVERVQDLSWWVVFRMTVLPGEIMGRGPALWALPSVKTLNQYVKLMLEHGLMAAGGAYKTDSYSLMNTEQIMAGVRANMLIPLMPGEKFERIEMSGDFQISQALVADQRERVREMLLGITLPSAEGTVKTATEFAVRVDQARRRVGPPFARVYSELINPLYRRIRHILMQAGKLEPIEGLDDTDIQVVAVSPLVQAVRKAEALEDLQTILTALQVAPEDTQMVVDVEQALTHFLAESGIPPTLFRSAEERAEIEAAQAQQQAAEIVFQRQLELQKVLGAVPANGRLQGQPVA